MSLRARAAPLFLVAFLFCLRRVEAFGKLVGLLARAAPLLWSLFFCPRGVEAFGKLVGFRAGAAPFELRRERRARRQRLTSANSYRGSERGSGGNS